MSVQQTVDRYLSLKSQIEQLKQDLDKVGEEIKAFGPCKLTGTLGQVEVCDVRGKKSVDWAKVCVAANVPETIVERFTKFGKDSRRIDTTLF